MSSSGAEHRKREANRRLLERVGRYYIQYSEIINLGDLEERIRGISERAARELEDAIRAGAVYFAVPELVRDIKDALDEMTREFSVEYGTEEAGSVLIPHTIAVMGSEMLAYMTTRGSRTGREYAVLGAIAREVAERANAYLQAAPEFDIRIGAKELLEEELGELMGLMGELPEGYILPESPYDPEWLRRAYRALMYLQELEVGLEEKKGGEELALLPVWSVLYELLTLYVLIEAFVKRGYEVIPQGDSYLFRAPGGSRAYRVTLNRALEDRDEVIEQVNALDRKANESVVNEIKGRPDIAFVREDKEFKVAFECKYSWAPNYITAGRFKLMAYIYEYNLDFGVLVFPGIGQESRRWNGLEETVGPLKDILIKERLLDIRLKNGKVLYMLLLDPLDDEESQRRTVDLLIDRLESGQPR